MTDKEICEKYSARDENNKVHCFECPLVIDDYKFICKRRVAQEPDLQQEYPEWRDFNPGKCHGCFGAANNDCVECEHRKEENR